MMLFIQLGLVLTTGSHHSSASSAVNLTSLTLSSDMGSRVGDGAHHGMILTSTVAPGDLSQNLTAFGS